MILKVIYFLNYNRINIIPIFLIILHFKIWKFEKNLLLANI